MRYREHTLSDSAGHTVIRSYHSTLAPQVRELREHHHTECELSVFLRGRGIYTVGKRRYEFRAGDAFLFGSNEAHCVTDIYEDMELHNIQFEPKLLWEQTDSVELLNLFAARSRQFSNRFEDRDGAIAEGIRAVEHELTEQAACYALTAKYRLFATLAHILRHYDCVDPARQMHTGTTPTGSLRLAVDYIHEHLDSPLKLAKLAEVAHMTPTYFSTVFKKYNGVSPWKYITIKRIERAVEMLQNTDLTKLEIAERCGFSSSSNFYKAFWEITGKKPGEFVR